MSGDGQVIYSIQIKTSDKLFAGTDGDVYISQGCSMIEKLDLRFSNLVSIQISVILI